MEVDLRMLVNHLYPPLASCCRLGSPHNHCYQFVEKIFERIIFSCLYEYVDENKLLSGHQSGFRSNDSCVNQLLSIVYNLYKAFDAYPTLETRGAFLDMSKAFDKVKVLI